MTDPAIPATTLSRHRAPEIDMRRAIMNAVRVTALTTYGSARYARAVWILQRLA